MCFLRHRNIDQWERSDHWQLYDKEVCIHLTASRSDVSSISKVGLFAGACPFCLSKTCSWWKTIRKSFDILLFWNRSEWSNNTFIYICTIQILQLLLLLLHFKTHRRKYQLKLLIISLVVLLCSVQQQVYLFSFFWGCSCNSLIGENKPPPAVGSYRRKISQSLEERIVLHVPQHWEKKDEGWRVLCWAGWRDCLGEIAKSESHWPESNNQEPFWTQFHSYSSCFQVAEDKLSLTGTVISL